MKDFDNWNCIKKNTELYTQRKKYHAGDIWWIRMGLNIGFEQDGKHEQFERPVLIVKGFSKEVCLIVPLTTVCKQNKFYFPVGLVDGKNAYAIISQIKLIDTKRLVNQIGFISREILLKIKKSIKGILD